MKKLASFVDWFRGDAGWVRLAAVVILIGTVLRFALAAISHPAGDSCLHLSVARFIAQNGRIPFLEPFGDGREVFWAPPLFHILAAGVYDFFRVFSTSAAEFAIKLVSPFFGALTLPFIFLIVKKLFQSSRLAFFAAFFVTFLPLHMYASSLSFVDSFVTFFTTAAIYFVLEKRIILASVLAGLSLSSKQNVLFILPVFFFAIFLAYRSNIRTAAAKAATAAAIILAAGGPWFVRNLVLLGNPFWPFLYKVLGGKIVPKAVESMFSVAYLFKPVAHIQQFYLEFFGVPSGSIAAFAFVQIPLMQPLLIAWFIATVIFFVPIVFGFFVRQNRNRPLLFVWLLAFFIMLLLYIMNLNMVFARLALPAIPAIAAFWALGFDRMLSKFSSVKLSGLQLSSLVAAVIICCAFAFSSAEIAKTVIASDAWSAYSSDFGWIKDNTPNDALIGYRGQCLSYNVDRPSNYNLGSVDYVWVNQGFKLEPISIVEPDSIQVIERNFSLVYENSATGTKIYERKQ